MIDTVYTTLYQRPEALNSINMVDTSGIFPFTMKYPPVNISELLNEVIAGKFIRVDGIFCGSWNITPDDRQNSPRLHILGDRGFDLAFIPVCQSYNRSLALRSTSTSAGVFTADVGFIDFGMTDKWIIKTPEKTPCFNTGDESGY